MGKRVPRRMRRFYRGGSQGYEPSGDLAESVFQQMPKSPDENAADEEITKQLALEEVQKFKEEHDRYPRKDEYDQIAENLYQQLHDKEEREKIFQRLEKRRPENKKPREKGPRGKRQRGKKPDLKEGGQPGFEEPGQPAEVQKPVLGKEEIEDLSVEDLFSGEGKSPEKKGTEKDLADEFSLEGLGGGKEEAVGCPSCGSTGTKIIFCPGCGAAFCKTCAKKSEKIAGRIVLTCPECGAKVKQ
ncbi:MAG: hypothetical protein JW744_03800 [Candidatus Diapherotrites archaeon]|uniref:Zinc ribbon domain-containing protein n=1 Tax=Candidatus Iainarchaeum sp. TaxID=3101447 RepID=A0A939CAA6_9ARCH|nr:hypothetical protein [Candidatus Diapherotrites archaeon]